MSLILDAFLVFLVLQLSAGQVPRPRGVSLSRAGLYVPEKNFTCFDGSRTVPFLQVNDDYCDCPDGSDEPGTSACPNGQFQCTNAGHKPLNIPSSRINDGVCDCCDGTDEYSGKISCTNNCLELGRTAREEAVKFAELLKVGKQLRADLSHKGLKLKEDKKQKLSELQKGRDEAERVKAEREQLKKQAEEVESKALEYYRELEDEYKKRKAEKEAEKDKAEAIEQFKKLDSNQDGLLDIAEVQSRESFDRDRNGEVSEEEAKLFLGNQDSVDLETFLDKSWRLIKPFLLMDSAHYKPPSTEEPSKEVTEEAKEAHDLELEEGAEEELEDDEDEKEPEEQPEEEKVPYDEETQKLVNAANDARNHYNEADKTLKDIEKEIKDLEESLTKDFGPEEEFASLDGQCFEFHDREYIYKLCPFDKTLQIPKSSSSETRLGKWSQWLGTESNRYESMLYDGGQACWNGPQRSTKVKLSCGTENKVVSVSEPNRCEYSFEFVTPAACRLGEDDVKENMHDEL